MSARVRCRYCGAETEVGDDVGVFAKIVCVGCGQSFTRSTGRALYAEAQRKARLNGDLWDDLRSENCGSEP